MAEEKPSLHIDNDWKRQAQEEKKRLVEEEARKVRESANTAAPSAAAVGLGPAAARTPAAGAPRRPDGPPVAGFPALVQSILTQILYYLGDIGGRGGEQNVNLDMAKYQIDILSVLEDKTKNNLAEDEKKMLDMALYETRMRYVNVASQYL